MRRGWETERPRQGVLRQRLEDGPRGNGVEFRHRNDRAWRSIGPVRAEGQPMLAGAMAIAIAVVRNRRWRRLDNDRVLAAA